MNNERYNQIIDEAWNSYRHQTMFDSNPKWLEPVPVMNMKTGEKSIGARQYHKNNFLAKCKTDLEFSERWGLKIEERELTTVKKRKKYDRFFGDLIGEYPEHHKTLDNRGVPTKLITVTYKDEKIEVYE